MSTADWIERRDCPFDSGKDPAALLDEAVRVLKERGGKYFRTHRKQKTGEIVVEGWRSPPPMGGEGDLPE